MVLWKTQMVTSENGHMLYKSWYNWSLWKRILLILLTVFARFVHKLNNLQFLSLLVIRGSHKLLYLFLSTIRVSTNSYWPHIFPYNSWWFHSNDLGFSYETQVRSYVNFGDFCIHIHLHTILKRYYDPFENLDFI